MKIIQDFDVKCKEHDIVSMVNDEYLKINNQLKKENTLLMQQNEKLIYEIANLKAQQLKVAKPFVDLTCDDDSDVEIIDEKKPEAKFPEMPKTPEVIQLKEGSNESKINQKIPGALPNFDLKSSDYEDFENFILSQI